MLNHVLKIYVPVYDPLEKVAETLDFSHQTAMLLSHLFGGCTVSPSNGYWINNTGELVEDKINIVYSFTDEDTLSLYRDVVENFCKEIKKELSQDAISLEIDGILNFI